MSAPCILLASRSPRRRRLLEEAGLPFRVVEPGPEAGGGGDPREAAMEKALAKARGARWGGAWGLLLGVDTLVAIGGRSLGKPRTRAEAEAFLAALEGRVHEVWSGLAFGGVPEGSGREFRPGLACRAFLSRVAVRPLSPEEKGQYLDGGDFWDKAGGYGIQSEARSFASLVEGSLENVIGLPLEPVGRIWAAFLKGRSLSDAI